MAKRFAVIFATALCAFAFTREAEAQWLDGKVAIRTNGNNFQSGDQLKVELLPLELISEHFYTQVTYSYNETVKETDDEGKVTEKQVERRINRERGPTLESLKQFQMITLDDSFHFGDASPGGRYTVQVRIFQAHTNRPLLTLRSCVFFHSSSEAQECDTFLRAVKNVHHEMFFTFEGRFNPKAYYTVTFLNRNKVIRHVGAGAFTDGARTLHLSSDKLAGLTGQTFDILLHDQFNGVSSTLSRVTIASVR